MRKFIIIAAIMIVAIIFANNSQITVIAEGTKSVTEETSETNVQFEEIKALIDEITPFIVSLGSILSAIIAVLFAFFKNKIAISDLKEKITEKVSEIKDDSILSEKKVVKDISDALEDRLKGIVETSQEAVSKYEKAVNLNLTLNEKQNILIAKALKVMTPYLVSSPTVSNEISGLLNCVIGGEKTITEMNSDIRNTEAKAAESYKAACVTETKTAAVTAVPVETVVQAETVLQEKTAVRR